MDPRKRDKIQGCLLGGAVGDALGYPVEFLSWPSIQARYGPEGIREHDPDMETGLALISDDTQMTLFTANGLLYREAQARRGIAGTIRDDVFAAYQDWLLTQTGRSGEKGRLSWLLDIPDLYARRAPGNTCLSALYAGRRGSIGHPVNDSKGCGGVMRAAPMGLLFSPDRLPREEMDREGAEIAAITHGHSLGYIPAAVLTHIVNVAVYGGCPRGDALADAVEDAMDASSALFGRDAHWQELRRLVDQAEAMAANGSTDPDNIHTLGGGWVAEETLAIAIYCALRYSDDFSRGVAASVNHSGDSDSTGAVTGNILGAWLGRSAIEEKWTRTLELKKVILEMADDLCDACPPSGDGSALSPQWEKKYSFRA